MHEGLGGGKRPTLRSAGGKQKRVGQKGERATEKECEASRGVILYKKKGNGRRKRMTSRAQPFLPTSMYRAGGKQRAHTWKFQVPEALISTLRLALSSQT